MQKKLFWVTVAFLTNPIIWLLGGLTLLTQGFLTYSLIQQPSLPVLAPSISLRNYGREFYYGVSFQRGPDGNAVRVPVSGIPPETVVVKLAESVDPMNPAAELRMWKDLEGVPDLKALRCDGRFNGDLSPLANLTSLESLSLTQYQAATDKQRKLPSLKSLVRLRELEVTSFSVEEIVEAVRDNKALTTLIYRGDIVRDATSDDLQKLSELKQLRVLAVGPFLRWESPEKIRESLASLHRNANLKLLYVGGIRDQTGEQLRAVQQLVPRVVVIPMSAASSVNLTAILGGSLLFMSGMWWLSGAISFSETNFRSLGSMLLPRFAWPHLLFVGFLAVGWIALNTLLFVPRGVPLLTCLSLFLAPIGFLGMGVFVAHSPNPPPAAKLRRFGMFGLFLVVFFSISSSISRHGNFFPLLQYLGIQEELWIEWVRFVYGFHPGIAVVAILLSLYSIARAMLRAPSTYRRLLEAGHVDPSLMGFQKNNPAFEVFGPKREGELPWLWKPLGDEVEQLQNRSPGDRRLEVLGLYSRISGIPRRFWLLMVSIPALGLACLVQVFWGPNDTFPVLAPVFGLLSGMAIYSPIFLVGHWASKGSRLGQEILVRPVERAGIRSLIARGIVRDIAIALLGLTVILIGALFRVWRQNTIPPWDTLVVVGIGMVAAFIIPLFAAYTQFVVTIRQGWLGKVCLFGGGIVVIASSLLSFICFTMCMDNRIHALLAFSILGLLIMISSWLVVITYRRLMTTEFG